MASSLPTEIQLPFALDSTGGIAMTTDPGQMVSQHIEAVVGTTVSERVMRVGYGTSIDRHIFDSNDPIVIADIQAQIMRAVGLYVPEATPIRVDIVNDPPSGTVGIKISYSMSSNVVQTVTTNVKV